MHGGQVMTSAELTEHRLRQLEELVAKLEGRIEERDRNMERSVARLHERLDERLKEAAAVADLTALTARFSKFEADELREEGAKAERRRLWKAWFQITAATVSCLGLLVAAAALFVH
jgi:Rad3-related DNA helicase